MLQIFFHPCDPLYFLLSSLLLLSRASSSLWFLFFLSFYLMFRFLILKQEHDVHRREFAIQFASQLHFIDNDDDGCDFFPHFCMHKRIPLECRVLGSSDLERYGSLSRSMVAENCFVCGKTSEKVYREKSPHHRALWSNRKKNQALHRPNNKASSAPTQPYTQTPANRSFLLFFVRLARAQGEEGEAKRRGKKMCESNIKKRGFFVKNSMGYQHFFSFSLWIPGAYFCTMYPASGSISFQLQIHAICYSNTSVTSPKKNIY